MEKEIIPGSEFKLLYTDNSKIQICRVEDFVTDITGNKICKSKREARDLHKGGGLYINKERVKPEHKYIMFVTNAVWDIPNKSLAPYYLLTEGQYDWVVENGINLD